MIRNIMIAIVALALFGWIANMFLNISPESATYTEDNALTADGEIDVGNYASVTSGTGSFDYVTEATDNENISMWFNGNLILDNYTLFADSSGTVENDLSSYVQEGTNTYATVVETDTEAGDTIENSQITITVDTDSLNVISTVKDWGPDIIKMVVAGIIALVMAYVLNIFDRI
jgi:hypothetical protein